MKKISPAFRRASHAYPAYRTGRRQASPNQRVVLALLFSSIVSGALFVGRMTHYDTWQYWFLNWNLLLAWLPLVFAWQLHKRLNKGSSLGWQNVVLGLLWLGFLPNSFYISSDLIHLQTSAASNILYDTVMLLSFSINGYLLGLTSIFIVHRQFVKRLKVINAHILVASVLLLCSFAIYLGRYLRWNTWDVLINPAGLLFDVSDRILNPSSHPQTFVTTLSFFALLGSIYVVVWQMAKAFEQKQHP